MDVIWGQIIYLSLPSASELLYKQTDGIFQIWQGDLRTFCKVLKVLYYLPPLTGEYVSFLLKVTIFSKGHIIYNVEGRRASAYPNRSTGLILTICRVTEVGKIPSLHPNYKKNLKLELKPIVTMSK